jgi:hypothetical protein
VSYGLSLIFWMRLTVATIVVTLGPFLRADDPTDQTVASDGYKTVEVPVAGGKSMAIKVKPQLDPYRNVSRPNTTGKYDPERIFSTASSMANKQFITPESPYTRKSEFDQNTFITRPYNNSSSQAQPYVDSSNSKNLIAPANANNKNTSEFSKSYLTSTADAGQNKAALLASSNNSEDQNRTAMVGGQPINTPKSSIDGKSYQGPESDTAHHHVTPMANGQMLVSDLPNRPLSIDEVRNLINHGFKPDTGTPPPEASKPLNDPNYKPEPLRDMPAIPASDDDKNDPVPPPGTMSATPAPENSEPLPQP